MREKGPLSDSEMRFKHAIFALYKGEQIDIDEETATWLLNGYANEDLYLKEGRWTMTAAGREWALQNYPELAQL